MIGPLRKLHFRIKAYWLQKFRTREIVRVYSLAHAEEKRHTPVNEWPRLESQFSAQISLIKQGKFAVGNPIYAQANGQVVDRRSWSFPFLPASVTRMAVPLAKMSPYSLRRFSRTAVARRAINLVKGACISQPWDVAPIDGEKLQAKSQPDQETRIRIAKRIFHHPNNVDSFQTWMEQGIEDLCCFGAFTAELRLTPDPERPLKSWPVMVESVRVFPGWMESTKDYPHYAQMTGLKGERGAILFYDDQLLYIKDNPSTDNPFGLGRMEVAYTNLNFLLGIQEMSGRAGSDQVHKTWLWWEQPQSEASYQIVRRHIQNELEGQSKVSIIGGMKKPEVIEIQPMTEQDLLLNWQEMLIRMIANAFDLSAMALGIEHDVNRAVGTVLADRDFRSAIVPLAKRLQEAFTRKILHEKLGWYDLEFRFMSLDDPDIETKIDIYQKAYAMNATTPKEFRKAMGWSDLNSPFTELTQFECMMLNLEASADIQNRAQAQMMMLQQLMQQQQQMQQQQNQPPPPPNSPFPPPQSPSQVPPRFPSTGGKPSTKAGATAKQPTAPPALKLPQFPIVGSKYSTQDIAAMSPSQLTAAFQNGELPDPVTLINQLDAQDPTVLEQLEEQVREFLRRKLQEARHKTKPGLQWSKAWLKLQRSKYAKDSGREQDMAEWIDRYGTPGKPGRWGGGPVSKKGGTPGNVNPVQKG